MFYRLFVLPLFWWHLVTAANVPQDLKENKTAAQPINTSSESQISEPNPNAKTAINDLIARIDSNEKIQASLIARMDTYENNLEGLIKKLKILESNNAPKLIIQSNEGNVLLNGKGCEEIAEANEANLLQLMLKTNAKMESIGKNLEGLMDKINSPENNGGINEKNCEVTKPKTIFEIKKNIPPAMTNSPEPNTKLIETNTTSENERKNLEELVNRFELLQSITQTNVTHLMELILQNKAEMQNMTKTQNELKEQLEVLERNTYEPTPITKFIEINTQLNDTDSSQLTPVHISPTVYITDIFKKDEPKECKVYNGSQLICSELFLPDSCTYSSAINCRGKQCRIRINNYGGKSFWVACDDDWIVIQRRINGTVSFDRNWKDYKNGFGDLNGEFWLGLDKIHALTEPKGSTEFKIEMQDFDNNWRYSHYKSFYVEGESEKYTLRLENYVESTGGDTIPMRYHHNEKFSTYDEDNDRNAEKNCASSFMGGWWHNNCDLNHSYGFSNLNGFYYKTGIVPDDKLGSGITWRYFGGLHKSLKYVQIKMRRK
ncbi:uncharacterized protein [Musca autumnalis]|uniref:uncharacterized protein n=1 Tax=Musca autumnalis TaxID=221902 RepID=UPI003CFADD99